MLDLFIHVRDHLLLSASALGVALGVGLPLGAAIARWRAGRGLALGTVYIARVVPSLAVLAMMIPLLGVGYTPALVALSLLGIPPICINTDLGLRSVPPAVVDAAHGMGMSQRELRRRIEWPLALPVVFAGIRTATIEIIASATLAAFIGGGGLGEYIVNGLANNDPSSLLEGAIAVAVLALAAEAALSAMERRLARRVHLAPA